MVGVAASPNRQFTDKASHDPIHILHVDDSSDFTELTATFLEEITDDITVTSETSTSEGYSRLERGAIDCIVSDYEMPTQNGVEFLRRVREEYSKIPFILFTGKGSEEVASEAITAGVTDYLQKGSGREQFELLANRIQNVVGQYRTDQKLDDLQRRYERVAHASADAFVDWKIQSDKLWWSEGLSRTFGYSSEESNYDFEWWKERIHPDDSQRVKNEVQQAIENQEELVDVEYQFRRANGTYAHIITRGHISYVNGKPVRATGALVDITESKERERTLKHLHQISRELIQAKTPQDICEIVASAAQEVVGPSANALYLWNESEGVLEPRASTPDTDDIIGDLPTFSPGSSIAWDVFIDGDTLVFEDVRDHPRVFNQETPIRSELLVPLGEYGVLISGATSPGVFTDSNVQLAETLAANTTAALQRADREQDLREKERVLREQNTSLTRLNRINSTIRAIQRDIVQATTRASIEQAVCNDLVQADHYKFVWIGSLDESDELIPRAWAGEDGNYIDELQRKSLDTKRPLPAWRALKTGDPVTNHKFRTQVDERPWMRKALDRGFQSQIAIPLTFKDSSYGVIEIYADRPTMFADGEKEILCEVSDFIANALNAVERRQAIVVESKTEIELHIEDADDVMYRLARQAECTLDLKSMFPQAGGEWLVYVKVSEGDKESLLTVADQLVSVDHITSFEGSDDVFEVVVSDFEIATVLGEHGATLHSLQARPDGGYIVIHLPQTVDVQSFIEACRPVFSNAELTRRNQIASEADSSGLIQVAIDQLTDRQRDVLEVAYRNGFFEWPREKTGEEVADRLDISPPTFHRHVRAGTKRLLGSIFE